ncbi:MAG TPA: hypothetical protein VFD31_08450 [Thermoleophilaceae bacterium]|nr:hypothetical protein [Thermoleophilaceae bacterium]
MAAGPATAFADDVSSVKAANAELFRGKQSLSDGVAAAIARERRALAPCKSKSKGKGWKRIRAVSNKSQRSTYTRGARMLWRELSKLAEERARHSVFRPAMERYVKRLEGAGISDSTVQAGVAAQRRRLSAQDDLVAVVSCKTFEKRLRRVRRVGGNPAEMDVAIGSIYNAMAQYVPGRRAAAARKFERPLDAAARRLEALGSEPGDVSGFLFGLSIAR